MARYNGYCNRMTWCAALWLSNDEGLDATARELCRDGAEEGARKLESQFYDWLNEAKEAAETSMGIIASMIFDMLPDFSEVDWEEIAATYAPEEEDEDDEEDEDEDLSACESCTAEHCRIDGVWQCPKKSAKEEEDGE